MAAYDLQVQKPSSLAIPAVAGASDLARFLSVSEAGRANREEEKLNQELFAWDKGAGDREKAVQEEKRLRTAGLGNLLRDRPQDILNNQKKNFQLHDEAVARYRAAYPDASEDQIQQAIGDVTGEITSNPSLYADRNKATQRLTTGLMSEGYEPEEFNDLLGSTMGQYFAPPSAPMNENILNGFIDVIKQGGLTDNVKDMELVQGPNGEPMVRFNGGSSGSDNGNLSQDEYRESSQYVQEIVNDPNNEFRKGRRSWLTANFPGTRAEAYRDDLEEMFVLGETSEGIQPQYIAGIMQSMTSEGQLPRGVKESDLKNPESKFYQKVMIKAKELQNRDMGVAGSGSAGGGGTQNAIPISALRELQQADLGMQTKALSNLLGMAGGARTGPLTADEQFQMLSGRMPQELAALAEQGSQNGNQNSLAQDGNSLTEEELNLEAPPEVPLNPGTRVRMPNGDEFSVEELTATAERQGMEVNEMISMLEGEGAEIYGNRGQENDVPVSNPPEPITQTPPRTTEQLRNLSDEEVAAANMPGGPVASRAAVLRDRVKNGTATSDEEQQLRDALNFNQNEAARVEARTSGNVPGPYGAIGDFLGSASRQGAAVMGTDAWAPGGAGADGVMSMVDALRPGGEPIGDVVERSQIESMSNEDVRKNVRSGPNRSKAYLLLEEVQDGTATEQQINELMQILNAGKQ